MADMFEFPRVEVDRERVTLYRTPFPKLTEAKVAQLAELHGMKAKPQDADSRIVFRGRVATLELFRASNSIRWSKLGNGKTEVKANGRRPALPDDNAARKGVAAFLRERKVPTKGAAVDSITHSMFARAGRENPGDLRRQQGPRRDVRVLARAEGGRRAHAVGAAGCTRALATRPGVCRVARRRCGGDLPQPAPGLLRAASARVAGGIDSRLRVRRHRFDEGARALRLQALRRRREADAGGREAGRRRLPQRGTCLQLTKARGGPARPS